ncbi:metallophosphoesterase [Anaerotignum sp.]|uniref:metallophosphoesterase n=1 Tax=Anaerotignum sp. TaxID=2039241 RepID=UPI0033275BC2
MTGRILITGDKHGTFLPLFSLAEKAELKKHDILIITGDAGYVWNEDFSYGIETLQQIFPGTMVFVDGNHENHALLNNLEICQWNGGKVHRVGERVYHLMRGEVYSIYGSNFFTFGGARSVDKDRREEGISWWKEEEPTLEEIQHGRKQLVEKYSEIDYIITHETPLFAREYISRFKQIDKDYNFPTHLEEWYHFIEKSSRFKKWYFGHMHVDQVITPKLRGVHTDIILVDEEKPIW